MIGVFCALDLVIFYVFFEAGLIPMFIIIGVWGGIDRIYASFKFFLYTLLGSLFMLAAVVYMYLTNAGIIRRRPAGATYAFDPGAQTWLWLAFFASFRGEAAYVAGAYLAARRARAGPDGWFRYPGGGAA